MIVQKNFIRFAAICSLITVITTLGIHAFFPDPPPSFEERVRLYRDPVYLLNRWWVIIHCLLVIVAMWGFALLQFRKAPGLTGLGFLFFSVFAIAEITRQCFVLFYMNGLREQYIAATDPAVREAIQSTLTYSPQLTAPLFGLFILSFGLGGTCYGLSLWYEKGFTKGIAVMLLVSGVVNIGVLANSFWQNGMIEQVVEKFNISFTPLMRLLTGIWLWKKASTLSTGQPMIRIA